jgi:hypothetical protein
MIRGRAEGGRDYFFDRSGSTWAEVNVAADRALEEVAALNVESQFGNQATPMKLAAAGPEHEYLFF